MKVVKITKRSSELRKLLESADREDIVVETPEGDLFLISAVDEFAYEIAQQRKNKCNEKTHDQTLQQGKPEIQRDGHKHHGHKNRPPKSQRVKAHIKVFAMQFYTANLAASCRFNSNPFPCLVKSG